MGSEVEKDIELLTRANEFVLAMQDRADQALDGHYPLWHGWALCEAWLAGHAAGLQDQQPRSES